MEFAVLHLHLKALSGKGTDEIEKGRCLRDTDKASAARDMGAEFADVNVTLRIRFRKSKKRLVKPAAMIKIKQLVLIDNRMRVERRTKFYTRKRCSANTAGFYCKRKIADSFFRSYCRNSFRHTDAKINYAAFLQLL